MPVYKDGNNGTFYVQCYYRDARGSKRHKTKRGFSSGVEAAVWESQFKSLNGGAMDMTFSEFVEVYAVSVNVFFTIWSCGGNPGPKRGPGGP